jgi:hypothetical protein
LYFQYQTLVACPSAVPLSCKHQSEKTWKPVRSESLRKAWEFVLEDEKDLFEIWLQAVI